MKRKNHTVPKALLKRWLTPHKGSEGLWVLDCKNARISFRPGAKASFATRDYLYVPVRTTATGQACRDETVENRFADGESDLAAVTDMALAGQLSGANPGMVGGFIQAVILLGFRSWYEFDRLAAAFGSLHPSWTSAEIECAVVDYYQRVYSTKLDQLKNWNYHLMRVERESLLVCDRPTFDATLHRPPAPMLTVPLAPNLLLVATPPEPGQEGRSTLALGWLPYRPGLVTRVNSWTVERAREFVVGECGALQALLSKFASHEFAARMAGDEFVPV